MNIKSISILAAKELQSLLERVDESQIEQLYLSIIAADKIFVTGAGRSLLMLRGFAMRLMHLGFASYVVGDTTTPAFTDKDLLIIGSGSGETETLVTIASKAKKINGKIILISTREYSTISEFSDVKVIIPAFTDKVESGNANRPLLPGGTLFEEAMLILCDSMVLPLSEIHKIPTDSAFALHANLE